MTVTQGTPPPNYTALGAHQAKADFAAAAGNGGWEFDPEAMDAVIKKLQNTIQGEFTSARNDAASLTGIDAPGDEVASHSYVDLANTAGKSYQDYLEGAYNYVKSYVETLVAVRNAYQRHDQTALDALRNFKKE